MNLDAEKGLMEGIGTGMKDFNEFLPWTTIFVLWHPW